MTADYPDGFAGSATKRSGATATTNTAATATTNAMIAGLVTTVGHITLTAGVKGTKLKPS